VSIADEPQITMRLTESELAQLSEPEDEVVGEQVWR